MESVSTLVIKVKYGETLRRFNALVNENGKLALDITGLRTKIISLFSLPQDADFALRYVDEDGDLVTLVDGEDLHDVMRQRLKFLRIDVSMDDGKCGWSGPKSSEKPPSLRSPGVPDALLTDEVLKSVPEPLREAVSKLSIDLASKVASSSPVIAELVDCFSKLRTSLVKSDSQTTDGSESGAKSVESDCPVAPEAPNSRTVNVNTTSETSASKDIWYRTGAPSHTCVDLNIPPCDSSPLGGKNVNFAPSALENSTGDGWKVKPKIDDDKTGNSPPTSSIGDKNSSQCTFATPVESPFAGVSGHDSAQRCGHERYHIPPLKRRFGHTPTTGGMFHRGVLCDGCGVYPITGPRFKSKLRENYDLCNICYNEIGNETDYIRMDRPVSYQHQRSLRSTLEQHPWMVPPILPHLLRKCSKKTFRPKLGSRFVVDVNVVDGTMMAPSTPFTKIWRMRNNGTLVWPWGTQLIWIGGDNFSDNCSVDIEIPVDGLPLDKELDIAVDFRAPESPGRYISYWRMASPSGQKFGQRVWVLIQVDASLSEPIYDSDEGLNLNFPPESCGDQGPRILDINCQPIVGGIFPQPLSCGSLVEPGKQESVEHYREEQEKNFPIDGSLLVGHGHATSELPSASDPVLNASRAAPVEDQSANMDAPASSQGIATTIEVTLLKELEEMGFKQIDLNKEILRINEYNLEQSVDDLCGVSEWDPILDELEEMGFHDKEMNKELLKKNNGSIKRVVMDLINGDNV